MTDSSMDLGELTEAVRELAERSEYDVGDIVVRTSGKFQKQRNGTWKRVHRGGFTAHSRKFKPGIARSMNAAMKKGDKKKLAALKKKASAPPKGMSKSLARARKIVNAARAEKRRKAKAHHKRLVKKQQRDYDRAHYQPGMMGYPTK